MRKWFEGTAGFGEDDNPEYESEFDEMADERPRGFPRPQTALAAEAPPEGGAGDYGTVMEGDAPDPKAVLFPNALKPEELALSLTDKEKVECKDASFTYPSAMTDEQRCANAELLRRLRNPTLALPSFIDEVYIANTTNFVNSDLRRIHEHRQFIRNVTGYPWPEEKPAPEDMPRILLDALRYPAFVIAFQSQIFARENKSNRSFIKRQIYDAFRNCASRIVKTHPLPFSDKSTGSINVGLYVVDHGADREVVRDELFWLAARVAWQTPCNKANVDLQMLVDRGEVWAEIGTYLRAVVEPFVGSSAMTIGDVFLKDFIPIALERSENAIGEPIASADEESTVISADETVATASTPASDTPTDLPAVITAWTRRSEEMQELSAMSAEAGPNADVLARLRSTLEALERLKDAAERLTPKSVSSAALVAQLQQMIDEVEDALTKLVGPVEEAVQIRSELTRVGTEVEPDQFASAETARDEALVERLYADEMAREIEEIEASDLPVRARRTKSDPLIDRQEQHLRNSMSMIGVSVRALVAGSSAAAAAIVQAEETTPATLPVDLAPPAVASAAAAETVAPIKHAPLEEQRITYDDDLSEPDFEPDQPAPVLTPPEPIATEKEPESRLGEEVLGCLDRLFALGEFGLAYHLASVARELVGEFDLCYDPAEFRLAAADGRAFGLDTFELQSLQGTRSRAMVVAQDLEGKDDDRSIARRILLLAGAIPAALLRSDDNSALTLIEQIGGRGSTSHYHPIFEVLEENRKRGYPVTATNLAAAEAHSNEVSFVAGAVTEIKATVEQFRSARFRFQLGEHVKLALTSQNGILGRLAHEIDQNPRDAADRVANELSDRDAIVRVLAAVTETLGDKEIDGPARDRIINALSRIGQQCADLYQSLEQLNAIRQTASRLEAIQRLRSEMLSGIEHVLRETETPTGGRLIDAANAHARRILEYLRTVCRGRGAVERDQAPLAVALHSPLLWIPNLTWTGGWTPSPYDAHRILHAIMAIETPLLGDDAAASLERAFEARKLESAFVPARMLLTVAKWHGVGSDKIAAKQEALATDAEARKANVRARMDMTSRQIDRMRRMAVGTLEQAARLNEALAAINVDALPEALDDAFLPEAVSGDRIIDFNTAQARLDKIEHEVKREFEKERMRFSERIETLCRDRNLDPAIREQLLNLLDRAEFTTLGDWINILNEGEGRKPLLPTGTLNSRLAFFREVLQDLVQNNQNFDLLVVKKALESGSTYKLIDYGRLEPDRRDDSLRTLEGYVDLKRAMKNTSMAGPQFQAQMTEVISTLFYDVTQPKDDPVLTLPRRAIYVYDARVALPQAESTSLVLPEFGSSTNGAWRICIVSSAISNSDLIQLANDAGNRGVFVLVLGVLVQERRTQIRMELIRKKRSMLVVDETMLAVALSDPDDRRRALVEMAQGYSYANPYRDHARAAVPPEMFKGRTRERTDIIDPAGSYVVFGGRRLGKTALLRHIAAKQPPHANYTYVDLNDVQSAADAFDRISDKIGTDIFKATVRAGTQFEAAVTGWLKGDDRRRLLLLIDEADKFVRAEAESGFKCIEAMLKLMADTNKRFKFVLAGLHNVSRIVRAENSPLVQISNNPLRIGPLVDRDVDDAEFLVRGPLAAMGYEFDSREDVWRVLSFTNYYPVLIQLFCQELLGLINEQASQIGKPPATIATKLVDQALTSSKVRKSLFASFEKTITSIEGRYELITYILAAREMLERETGMAAEGMTSGEVAEKSMDYWPAAFPKGSDPNELEYLLEEMEGFGIARRTPTGRFALRSRSLLELMTTSESELRSKLESFRGKDAPPKPFDPKNYRRKLSFKGQTQSASRFSPLTDGQEAVLLSGETYVGVVFGPPIGGISLVETALGASKRAVGKVAEVEAREVDARFFASKRDLVDSIKRAAKGSRHHVLAVSSNSSWQSDWVLEAERHEKVRTGDVRLVFVGSPQHARNWAADPAVRRRALPQIRVVKLRPWTRSFLGSQIDALQLNHDLVDRILQATGGWNEVIGPLMEEISEKPENAAALIAEAGDKALGVPNLTTELGVPTDLLDFFRELATYADGSKITATDFQTLCTWEGRTFDPKTIGAYGDLMGLLSFPPDEGSEHQHRKVYINPLALAALTAGA